MTDDERAQSIPSRWLDEVSELIAIPSVSADPSRSSALRAAGDWVSAFVRDIGGTSEVVAPEGRPVIVGRVCRSVALTPTPRTVVLYGHFDVQPEGDRGAWETDPFVPAIRDGSIYARGSADSKINLYILLRAVAELVDRQELPVDVVFIADGEEEIGGTGAARFIEAPAEPLGDACLLYDGTLHPDGTPVFTTSLRGLLYYSLLVQAPWDDLHSGYWGGIAPNAVHALVSVLHAVMPMAEPLVSQATGSNEPDGRDAEWYEEAIAATVLDINGVQGGETGMMKTIIPGSARANLSLRVAPGESLTRVAGYVEARMEAAVPAGIELDVERIAAVPSVRLDPGHPVLDAVAAAFAEVFEQRPLLRPSGATVPVAGALHDSGIPTVITGFASTDANKHAANERFELAVLPRAVDATCRALVALGDSKGGA